MGLRTIVDLRRGDEVAARPNVLAGASWLRYRNVPMLAEAPGPAPLTLLYRHIVDAERDRVCEVVALLAAPDALPAAVHCTIGKGRTGVIAALLLSIADVSRATIADDYAATARYIAGEFTTGYRARIEAAGGEWSAYRSMLECPPAFIIDTLAHIDERYGGVVPYLLDGGVARSSIESLRRALVE